MPFWRKLLVVVHLSEMATKNPFLICCMFVCSLFCVLLFRINFFTPFWRKFRNTISASGTKFYFIKIALYAIIHILGGVPEWTNGALSKSVRVLKALSGVRIPPPPRMKNQTQIIYNLVVVILALVGVIVVLVLHVVGIIGDSVQTTQLPTPESALELASDKPEESNSDARLPEPVAQESQPQATQEPEQQQVSSPEPAPSQPESVSPPPVQQPTQFTQPFNDKDCGDFQTHAQAQAFFESQGGPAQDPHKLDRNKDGVVCESLR